MAHDARQTRRAQSGLGHTRSAGRARGRTRARHLGQAADRGVRHREIQREVPRVGVEVPQGVGRALRTHGFLARLRRRVCDLRARVRRVGVGDLEALPRGRARLQRQTRRAVLRPLRHGALVARARPTGRVPRRARPERHRAVALDETGERRTRELARVDDDAVDVAFERRVGRASGCRVRARAGAARRRQGRGEGFARLRACLARCCARRGGARSRARGARDTRGARARGLALPAALRRRDPRGRPRQLDPRTHGAPHRRHGDLRHDRGRHRHRAPSAVVRRGRLGHCAKGEAPRVAGRRRGGPLRRRARRRRSRHVLQGRRRRADGGPQSARTALQEVAREPQLPALLALQDGALLLRDAGVVPRDDALQGSHDRAQPPHALGAARGGGEAARGLAREQRRLEHLARTVLGHSAAVLGVHRVRRTTRDRQRGRAARARRFAAR